MRQIIPIDIRWGLKAPRFYIRILNFVFMWWGWNNGKFEFRYDRGDKIIKESV